MTHRYGLSLKTQVQLTRSYRQRTFANMTESSCIRFDDRVKWMSINLSYPTGWRLPHYRGWEKGWLLFCAGIFIHPQYLYLFYLRVKVEMNIEMGTKAGTKLGPQMGSKQLRLHAVLNECSWSYWNYGKDTGLYYRLDHTTSHRCRCKQRRLHF